MPPVLVIGNKAYSSWSLRPWILLAAFGIPFEEKVVPLYEAGSKTKILKHSPSGKVPALIDGDITVFESIAIFEYLAEKYPAKAIWPKNRAARARARSLCAEMHAGFTALRTACPTNFRRAVSPLDPGPEAMADVARLEAAWASARETWGRGGPFLFGKFCAADAMFAPVANRIHVYDIPVSPAARGYINALLALPAYQAWLKDAAKEKRRIEAFEK
jgi:glutathione S-transferase